MVQKTSVSGSDSVFEYYKYKDFLFKKPEISDLKVESEHFLSYFAQVQYNTYDKGVSLLKEVTSEPPIHSIRIIWHNITNTLHFQH